MTSGSYRCNLASMFLSDSETGLHIPAGIRKGPHLHLACHGSQSRARLDGVGLMIKRLDPNTTQFK